MNPETRPPLEAVPLALAAYEASLNSIISMVAIRDDNGDVVDFLMQTANRAVERSLFMPPEKIIGTRLLETFPGNLESGLFALYKRVVETGLPEQTVQHYIDTKGLIGWFEVSAVQPEPERVVLTFMNVTLTKQAERDSQRQAELLQAILDHTQTPISLHEAIRDKTGKIVDFRTVLANKQAIRMWSELAEPILTKTFFEVTTVEQQTDDFPKYVRVVETGEPDLTEFYGDDQWWLRFTGRSGDGVVISNVDISEIRQYQQQLERANVELKRSNESLQSFAYIASHDLQEPLRKIQSFGDILQSRYGPALGADGSELISRMQSAAERMSLLIKDLLNYSRISSQRATFRKFPLTRLIEDIIEDLWHSIQQTGAHIDIGCGNTLPDLNGDRAQLRQLFQNLLSNSIKFHRRDAMGSPISPLVRISARHITDVDLQTEAKSDLLSNRSYWAVCIADNGIGFEQKYVDQIFQVFQRLHNKQQFTGTGIGLAVAKKVVEQHDGAIQVVSEPGVGTTFTVYLPV